MTTAEQPQPTAHPEQDPTKPSKVGEPAQTHEPGPKGSGATGQLGFPPKPGQPEEPAPNVPGTGDNVITVGGPVDQPEEEHPANKPT